LWRSLVLPPLSREVQRDLARYPALKQFVRGARRKRTRAAAFKALLATDFITEYLNRELERLARGEASTHRVTEYLRGFTIVQAPEFALRVRFFTNSKRKDIYSLQRETLLSPLGGTIEITRYCVPEPAQRDTFDKTARLTEDERKRLEPGEIAAFRSRSEAYAAVPQSPQIAMLIVEDQRTEALSWRFDPETLLCIGAISSDPAVSRLRETLELAVALKLDNIAGPAQSLLDHPSHIVRWSALAAVSRLSRREALPVLRRGARDRNPQLRRAAQRLLQQELSHGPNA
jgi:hypothetical protein